MKKLAIISIIIVGLFLLALEFQILNLAKKINKDELPKQKNEVENVVQEAKIETDGYDPSYTSRHERTDNKYKVEDNSLLKEKVDWTDEIIIPDLKNAGAKNVICDESYGVYIVAQPGPHDEYLFLTESCENLGGTVWQVHIPTKTVKKLDHQYFLFGGISEISSHGDFQVMLGKTDKDGEVRKIILIDFIHDQEYEISQLPQNLTYKTGIDDHLAIPYGEITVDENDWVRAEVYLSGMGYDPFDVRKPVLNKNIYIYNLLN